MNHNNFESTNKKQYFKLMSQRANGRVVDINSKHKKQYPLFEQKNNNKNSFKCNVLTGIQEQSELSLKFFSNENIQNIQNLIRYTVYLKTDKKHNISQQSDLDLKVIMRSIYLQHSANLKYYIDKQINFLNKIVVDWSYPRIVNEIDQYVGYVQSLEKLPVPLEHPVNLSSSGTKTLRSVTSTF
jgi:hypothetical protein